MKKFFNALIEGFKSYDLIVILVSSVVGAIVSLVPQILGENKDQILISYIVLICFIAFMLLFLLAIITVNYFQNRFHYLHKIKKAKKEENWHAVYTYGEPLSTPLWLMSQLSLRIEVAKLVEEAITKLNTSEVNGEAFDPNEKLAKLYIDDFGYTNYVLGNIGAKGKIETGLDYATKINSSEKRIIWELKGRRHILAMCSNGDINDKLSEIEYAKFAEKRTEAEAYIVSHPNKKLMAEIKYAYYADLKYRYQKQLSDEKQLREELKSLKDELLMLKKSEWVEKCDQLFWEMDLKSGCNIEVNANEIGRAISQHSIFPNRFVKMVNLYLDYKIFVAKSILVTPNIHGTNDQLLEVKELKAEVMSIIKTASKKMNESEDRMNVTRFETKKKEFFKIINRKIYEIKRNLVIDRYDIILVDFDYTIFNYKKAQEQALKKTFKEMQLRYKKGYAESFRIINNECWNKYKNTRNFEQIKVERVSTFLKNIEHQNVDDVKFLSLMEEYMTHFVPMRGLKKFFRLCDNKKIVVITDASKSRRIKSIDKYLHKKIIEQVFSSEDCNCFKNNIQYFKSVLQHIGQENNYERVLIVGDGMDTDIEGGRNAGIDTCFVEYGYELRTGEAINDNIAASYCVKTLDKLSSMKIRIK